MPRDQIADKAEKMPVRNRHMSNAAMITDLASLGLKFTECAIIVVLGVLLVAWLGDDFGPSMVDDHYRLTGFAALLYLTLASAVGAYDVEALFVTRRRIRLLLRTWGITALFLVMLGFVLKASAQISREWALIWFFSCAVGLWLARIAFTAIFNRSRATGVFDVRTAVFGGGEQAARLLNYLRGNRDLTLSIVGRYDDRDDERDARLGKSKGGLTALLNAIRRSEVDQVIVALPWASESRVQDVVQQLALTPVRIRLAPDLVGFAFMDKPFALLGNLPVLTLFDRPISGLDQSLKWVEDQVLGWALVILLSPLLLAIAIAIKLDSRGPVLFKQSREGFNDRQFQIWKFRSMYVEECEDADIRQAVAQDPRVTRVGSFLRRTSLDELPQLFNVTAGEMSLVGPRPHAPSTRAGPRLFRDVVSSYAARHRVKPGLTGWAQVNGWRGPTDTDDKLIKRLEHDLYYIENWSIGFDIVILFRTLLTPITARNAL